MLIPKSHKHGVLAAGHDKATTSYPLWTLDHTTVEKLCSDGGLVVPTGKPGGVLMFHGNLVHGSAGNITPYAVVYLTLNAVSNYIRKPTRPEWIAHQDFRPIEPCADDALLRYAQIISAGGGVARFFVGWVKRSADPTRLAIPHSLLCWVIADATQKLRLQVVACHAASRRST